MMGLLLSLAFGTFSLKSVVMAVRADRVKKRILLSQNAPSKKASVSLIIPVRDEERNIADALKSLVSQGADEVVVVDDASKDATRSIVLSFAEQLESLRLISARELPTGWSGKNNACYEGYLRSFGDILFFMDADVRLAPGALDKIYRLMEEKELDFLSISPSQSIISFGERVVLPGLFLGVVERIDFDVINDPSKEGALANGQIMVFRRVAYEKIGTHEAVKGEVGEDVALARLAKKARLKTLFFYDDGSFASVRMYRDFKECLGGFSKNLSDIVSADSLPSVLFHSSLALIYAILSCAVPILLFFGFFGGTSFWLAIFSLTLWVSLGVGALKAMKVPLYYIVALPFGYLAFSYLLLKSYALKTKKRRVWKGRSY